MSDAARPSAAPLAAAAAAVVDDDEADDDDDDDDDGLLRQSRLLVRLMGSATIPLTYSTLSDAVAHGSGGGR